MRQLAASYSPSRVGDLIFLHGLAISAARRALREGEPLYVPREWADDGASGETAP